MLILLSNVGGAALAINHILNRPIGLVDDAFIYLHIAHNIVESGTAQYFPVANSWALLASSPLRLASLLPGISLQKAISDNTRTLESARIAWAIAALAVPLLMALLWRPRYRLFGLATLGYWILLVTLPTAPMMESALVYLASITFVYQSVRRDPTPVGLGVSVIVVVLVRPELGLIASVVGIAIATRNKQLRAFLATLLVGTVIYCALALTARVYPVPTTVLSKDLTARLGLFGEANFASRLGPSLAETLGLSPLGTVGLATATLLLILPLALSARLPGFRLAIAFSTLFLAVVAIRLPSNYAWYTENYLAVLFVLYIVVIIGAMRNQRRPEVIVAAGTLALLVSGLMIAGGRPPAFPWNEGTGRFRAYSSVGAAAAPLGTYRIPQFSHEPVRISMCEIGLAAYLSGPQAWMEDKCGLAQPGELLLRADSPLRHLYPRALLRGGDEEIALIESTSGTTVALVDVWGIGRAETAAAEKACGWFDRGRYLCIAQAPSAG